ncbi:MAG: limonene-1,2-epoxide hydrolase family protein [Spongiibacteraceae bacterium]
MSKYQEQIIEKLIATVATGWPEDLDNTMADIAEDAEYIMIVPTTPAIKGKAAIRSEIQAMMAMYESNRSTILRIGSSDNSVFTERVDGAKTASGWIDIPVMAVFDFNDKDQIISWREYMDLANIVRQQGEGAIIGLPEGVRTLFK